MTKIRVVVIAVFVFLATNLVGAVETVRVDASSGAPRIVVDGKPVRARIFWGAPGSRPLPIGPVARQISFEFSPTEDEPSKATMHFRFGDTPGEVFLDDLRVVDAQNGADVVPLTDFESGQAAFDRSWSVWPPADKNTVGKVKVEAGVGRDGSSGLHISLQSPPDGKWPGFHFYHQANLSLLKGHRYRVTLWARAEPARDLTIGFYRPGSTYVDLGGPPSAFEQEIKLAADAGVDFVSFPTRLPWPKEGEPENWSSIDRLCETVLAANPKALMIARIDVNAPAWWMESHPDDAMVWDKGEHKQVKAVVASSAFRHDAAYHLAALVKHLEEKFGPHMAGYHPAGQNTDEWFYQDTWLSGLNGYSKTEERAWRDWLTTRYPSDDALRTAWHDLSVSLATAATPSPAMRRANPAGVFRDPIKEREIIDFSEFQQQMMADCVCTLAKAVRDASRGRKLVLFFYGYGFEFGAIVNGPPTSGHYALRRVLSSPDIDILCSPISYFDRGLGQSAPAMTAAESIALAGKMYLEEDDTHTYLATGDPPGSKDHVDTLEKTNQELLRNTADCGLRNLGTWWMDLGASGWFNDPGMWAQMAKLSALDQPMLDTPTPYRPEIAAVIDERSMMRVGYNAQEVTSRAVYRARQALGRMGAPYGQYLLDDVLAGKVHAKVYVFLSAWRLDPEQRRKLLEATHGAVRIWCYAPGFQEEHDTTLDGTRELTGFQLRENSETNAWAIPTAHGKELGMTEPCGWKHRANPLFAVTDASPDEALATYPDGSTAIALRKTDDGTSLFVGPPGLTSDLLRVAVRQAGAHLYTQADCNVCANGPFVVLHGADTGPLEIDTGRAGAVYDLITNEKLGSGPRLTLPIAKGQTRILKVEQK